MASEGEHSPPPPPPSPPPFDATQAIPSPNPSSSPNPNPNPNPHLTLTLTWAQTPPDTAEVAMAKGRAGGAAVRAAFDDVAAGLLSGMLPGERPTLTP